MFVFGPLLSLSFVGIHFFAIVFFKVEWYPQRVDLNFVPLRGGMALGKVDVWLNRHTSGDLYLMWCQLRGQYRSDSIQGLRVILTQVLKVKYWQYLSGFEILGQHCHHGAVSVFMTGACGSGLCI